VSGAGRQRQCEWGEKGDSRIHGWLVLNSTDTFDFTTPLYPARITGWHWQCARTRDAASGHLVAETVIGNYDGERSRYEDMTGGCNVVRSATWLRLFCHWDVFTVIGLAFSSWVAAVLRPLISICASKILEIHAKTPIYLDLHQWGLISYRISVYHLEI